MEGGHQAHGKVPEDVVDRVGEGVSPFPLLHHDRPVHARLARHEPVDQRAEADDQNDLQVHADQLEPDRDGPAGAGQHRQTGSARPAGEPLEEGHGQAVGAIRMEAPPGEPQGRLPLRNRLEGLHRLAGREDLAEDGPTEEVEEGELPEGLEPPHRQEGEIGVVPKEGLEDAEEGEGEGEPRPGHRRPPRLDHDDAEVDRLPAVTRPDRHADAIQIHADDPRR